MREGNVPKSVSRLLKEMDSPERRADISVRLQRLVDGKGAERLASLILKS
ncbi:MAG: hypothetical protein II154_05590 [Lachnospiraceae bacterium]|nr:hypothetical protein [Lachnospiraceae bacterium]